MYYLCILLCRFSFCLLHLYRSQIYERSAPGMQSESCASNWTGQKKSLSSFWRCLMTTPSSDQRTVNCPSCKWCLLYCPLLSKLRQWFRNPAACCRPMRAPEEYHDASRAPNLFSNQVSQGKIEVKYSEDHFGPLTP